MKIKWNMKAFQEIRTSNDTENMLQGVVDGILSEVGTNYEGNVETGKTRSRGGVVTSNYDAILENSTDNTLLRALSNARVGGL